MCLTVLLSAGCGTKSARVTGKVFFDGKPLSRGQVSFVGEDNKVVLATIDREGKYSVQMIPGQAKILVSVPPPFRPLAGGTKTEMDPAKFGVKGSGILDTKNLKIEEIKIPPQYNDLQKTPLSYTVKAGEQEHDIKIGKN
jgi:hypothetical protein